MPPEVERIGSGEPIVFVHGGAPPENTWPEQRALAGFAGLPDGSEWIRDALRGDPEQPAAVGEALAARMLAAGAADILKRAGEGDWL